MNVLNIRYEEYGNGIPLQGMENVKAALRLFSDGSIAASNATTAQLAKDGAGMTAVLKRYTEAGKESTFLRKLFDNIDTGTSGPRGSFYHSFDYDGVGSFFKTTVQVETIDKKEKIYLLMLHAAYVGKKVEEGLANALGIERGLQWVSVGIETQPVGDRFLIDFNEVAQKLRNWHPCFANYPDGKEILASGLVPKDNCQDSKPVVLATINGYVVSVRLDDVGNPFDYRKQSNPDCSWIVGEDGVTVSGPLREDWEDKTKFLNPTVEFVIRKWDDNAGKTSDMPILDPEMKNQVREIAEHIRDAFERTM